MGQTGALQHARKIRDDARAAAGDRRTVFSVIDVAGTELAGAAADRGQARAPDEGSELSAIDFISHSKLAEAVEVVAKVEAATSALIAKHSDAGQPAERVARHL